MNKIKWGLGLSSNRAIDNSGICRRGIINKGCVYSLLFISITSKIERTIERCFSHLFFFNE